MGVLDDAISIDEEGGALGDASHNEVLLGEELIVSDAVSFGGFVIVVGEKLEGITLKRVMPSFSAHAACAKGLSPEIPRTVQLRSE